MTTQELLLREQVRWWIKHKYEKEEEEKKKEKEKEEQVKAYVDTDTEDDTEEEDDKRSMTSSHYFERTLKRQRLEEKTTRKMSNLWRALKRQRLSAEFRKRHTDSDARAEESVVDTEYYADVEDCPTESSESSSSRRKDHLNDDESSESFETAMGSCISS